MRHVLRHPPAPLLLGLLAVCLPLLTASAASDDADLHIRDNGNFFSADTRAKADAQIAQMAKAYNTELVIETYAAIPDDLKADFDQAKKAKQLDAFYETWAEKRGLARQVHGIVLLICRDPAHLEVRATAMTQKRAFKKDANANTDDQLNLSKLLVREFTQGPSHYDDGLLQGVALVESTLVKNLGPTTAPSSSADPK